MFFDRFQLKCYIFCLLFRNQVLSHLAYLSKSDFVQEYIMKPITIFAFTLKETVVMMVKLGRRTNYRRLIKYKKQRMKIHFFFLLDK